jgi:hypothetical protein
MLIQPIDYFLLIWFILAAASTAYVAWDQFRNNPEPVVMKWGFILVTLYMGPLGLLIYVLADKEPRPGEHEEFIKPLWKQGVGSNIRNGTAPLPLMYSTCEMKPPKLNARLWQTANAAGWVSWEVTAIDPRKRRTVAARETAT